MPMAEVCMPPEVGDQLAIIKIEGLHCHKCEQTIRKVLTAMPGVHEVEVDFLSGQASVLYGRDTVTVKQLMDGINNAGYRATGFNQPQPHASSSHADTAESA
jgi:uncharacterized protein